MSDSKIRWDLIPIIPLEEAAKVMTFGASKYCDSEGWREIPLDQHYAALLRHLVEWKKAHDHDFQDMKYDHESRLHHLAHYRQSLLHHRDRSCHRDAKRFLIGHDHLGIIKVP